MYHSSSQQDSRRTYVFDEQGLTPEAISLHPRCENLGAVIKTLEDVPLQRLPGDSRLTDVLEDCSDSGISNFVAQQDYDLAIAYVTGYLSRQKLDENKSIISIHVLESK